MFNLLVKIRLQSLKNVARDSASRHRLLTIGLVALGFVIFAAIYLGFDIFLSLVHTADERRGLVYEVFYFLFLFLLAGAVPFVASTLFHSGDYLLLSAAPLSPRSIVAAKLLDATVTNSLQFTMIGVPAIAACGAALSLPAIGWLFLPVVVALFVLLPALITALLLLIALATLGMRRVRSAITVVNGIMATVVCLTIVLQAGRLQLHQGFQPGFGAIATESSVSSQLSPAGPFAFALIRFSDGDLAEGLRCVSLLALLIGLLYAACMQWGGRLLSAASLAEEGSDAAVGSSATPVIRANSKGLLRAFASPVAALIAKDLKYVARDSVLLSQLGMPVILFLVPFVLALQQRPQRGLIAPMEIYPFAAAMTGIIVFMQTSILSLTSIGIESRSFWLVLASPNGGRTLLWAKFVMSTLVSAGVGIALTILSCIVFQAGPWIALIQSGLVLLCSAALCGMGVGISAALPRFVYENPAHRVSAWALILGFISTVGYLTVSGVLILLVVHLAGMLTEQAGIVYGIGGGLYFLITLLAILLPMTVGAKRIEVYQWEH